MELDRLLPSVIEIQSAAIGDIARRLWIDRVQAIDMVSTIARSHSVPEVIADLNRTSLIYLTKQDRSDRLIDPLPI